MDFASLKSFECQLDDGLFHIKLNRPDEGQHLQRRVLQTRSTSS